MRLKLLIPFAGALALASVCLQASAAPPQSSVSNPTNPAIRAKQAQATHVLNEIAAIDETLNTTSEEFDGARVRLKALRANLHAERDSLATARAHYRVAQQRVAKLLVWLYTSNHSSALDVILGAHNLTDMLRLSDAENAISKQAAGVTHQAQDAKSVLVQRVRALDSDRKAAQSTVNELAARRAQIEAGLAKRRTLLGSVQSEVTHLESVERAKQERIAAEVAARLRREAAARAKAEAAAAARARAAAEAAAAAKAKADAAAAAAEQTTTTTTTTTTTATTTTVAPLTTAPASTAQATTTTASASPFSTPSPVLTGPLPAGHPEAAQIALQYLGIPYLWGGASPSGFDCSGLVTYVFAQLGVSLPHFAAAQWDFGVPVTIGQLQPGDLVFFDGLDHVGIYLGNNQFINAPHTGAFVRIDTLDEGWYAKNYVGARRV
jgi:cell wall-associated NlpC family hydrolase